MNTTFEAYAYQILEYLTPENIIALVIVRFLQFVFLLWVLGFIYSCRQLRANQRQMFSCEDVGILVKARQKHHVSDRESEQSEGEIFSSFCKEKSVQEQTVGIRHLKCIFLSGWNESRFEVSELLGHTTHILFQENNLLRSVLASFIVLGLLGTLFGLADSLAHLSPVLGTSGFQKTNEGITYSLGQLLSHIKSAFAPSIWGVTFTVIGVFLYGFYLRFVCSPVKSTLEQMTLTNWVPQLYPTTSQKLIETLQQSEQQMRQNFEAARKVAELADSVQTGIGDFNQNLSQANLVTGSLTAAVSEISQAANLINKTFAKRLSKFSDEFSGSVSHLTSFQEDLRILYQKMVDESDAFQSGIRETLYVQNSRLENILKTFKNYEDAYIAERGQIDNKMQKFLDEATEVNTSINTQNRQLVEEISNKLTTSLGEIENTLKVNLSSITQRFDSFDVPIKNAAEKIEGSHENFYKLMGQIITDLQSEVRKQNVNYEQHLTSLIQVKQRIETLLTHLTQNSQLQTTETQKLSQSVNKLTEDITSLSSNINSLSSEAGIFSNSVNAIEQNIQSLGKGAQILAETSKTIAPLANIITDFSGAVKQLQQDVLAFKTFAQRLELQQKPSKTLEKQTKPQKRWSALFFWRK